MLNRQFRQTGAFILATVVFLMVAGSVMLYAMTNLSVVTSATTSVTHNGNMALMAAQSGLKYCVAQLEGTDTCTLNPQIMGVSSPDFTPCKIKVVGNCVSGICTITSTACCPNSTDSLRGVKKLTLQVQKTTGGIQMIPASRFVAIPDTPNPCD